MFKPNILAKNNASYTLLLLGLIVLAGCLTGCSDDDPVTPSGKAPEAAVAASLIQPSQTIASVEENMNQLEMFENPLSDLADGAGMFGETNLEGWTGEGMSFPDQASIVATKMRGLEILNTRTVKLTKSESLPRLVAIAADKAAPVVTAAGDTLEVVYFDTPDSTGLNAVVVVTAPDVVKYVVQRAYPVALGHPVRIEQEVVFDTNGTLEDLSDDLYYSAVHELEMAGGEIAYGSLAPVSGDGPISDGVQVLAHSRVENPRWHILQAWNESDIVIDLGDFRDDGDETIYSANVTVHWRTNAEYIAEVTVPTGGPIESDSQVRALATLTAAPTNNWLESISDTLFIRLGDLEVDDDDLLVEVSRGAVFDGTASDGGSPRHYVHFLPDEPVLPGEEPCGGQAEQDIWYPAVWWLVHLQRDVDIDCGGSGVLHSLQELRDGTSFERTITWDGSGNATVTEDRLDGTLVTGTFNESTGEYLIDTTFPVGNDPISRSQFGQGLEGSIVATDVFIWQDTHADTTHFEVTDGDGTATVSGYKVRGDQREDFTVTVIGEDGAEQSITGQWSRNDGASGQFSLESLEGGSSHLVYSAADPQADGNPSVSGDLYFAPDGSGYGTIVLTQYGSTATYEITFGPDGEGSLSDGAGEVIPF